MFYMLTRRVIFTIPISTRKVHSFKTHSLFILYRFTCQPSTAELSSAAALIRDVGWNRDLVERQAHGCLRRVSPRNLLPRHAVCV